MSKYKFCKYAYSHRHWSKIKQKDRVKHIKYSIYCFCDELIVLQLFNYVLQLCLFLLLLLLFWFHIFEQKQFHPAFYQIRNRMSGTTFKKKISCMGMILVESIFRRNKKMQIHRYTDTQHLKILSSSGFPCHFLPVNYYFFQFSNSGHNIWKI